MVDQAALLKWAREEQEALWDRLVSAINRAANGTWSIECENLAASIVRCARIIGPTSYGDISWDLVTSGIYGALLEHGGVFAPLPGSTEWAEIDDRMQVHTSADRLMRYDETRRRIQALPPDWWRND